MILVDTSVLIDYFADRDNEEVEKFQKILDRGNPFGICLPVYLEVLMGAKNDEEFKMLDSHLSTHHFYHLKYDNFSYEQAAKIYYKCRKQGFTIASTIDCLIAQTAIENDLYLLHRDRDFDRIANVVPLKLF